MTIEEAIKYLVDLRESYGGKVIVYFDCPNCNKCFTPNKVVAQAIHITSNFA